MTNERTTTITCPDCSTSFDFVGAIETEAQMERQHGFHLVDGAWMGFCERCTEDERLPQHLDRVVVVDGGLHGQVHRVAVGDHGRYSFKVHLMNGGSGWYRADQLRIVRRGPASDPKNYR